MTESTNHNDRSHGAHILAAILPRASLVVVAPILLPSNDEQGLRPSQSCPRNRPKTVLHSPPPNLPQQFLCLPLDPTSPPLVVSHSTTSSPKASSPATRAHLDSTSTACDHSLPASARYPLPAQAPLSTSPSIPCSLFLVVSAIQVVPHSDPILTLLWGR